VTVANRTQVERRGRCQGDDGSLIAELALVVPLLVVLALGIFEYGFVLRNSSVLANSLRSASRSASQAQLDSDSDLFALQTFAASTANLKNVTVNRVIIYNAGTANGKPPAACLTASLSGSPPYSVSGSPQCNVYDASDIAAAATGNFTCTASTVPSTTWDKNWDACHRNNSLAGTIDYVGVYADVTYNGITGLLPGRTLNIKDYSVNRIEPNA